MSVSRAEAMMTQRSGFMAERRSHRYLRVALVGVVIVIVSGVLIESSLSGIWLPSISHYYYSPARNVFVGSLVVASIAFLVLSGTDAESAWLDFAAPFAPLIALIPVAVEPDTLGEYAKGLTFACADDPGTFPAQKCIPAEFVPGIISDVSTYLLAVTLILVAAFILWRTRQLEGSWIPATIIVGLVVLVVVAAMLVPMLVDRDLDGVLLDMHFPATAAFFVAFAAVPLINAFALTSTSPAKRWQRVVYVAVAVILPVDIVLTSLAGFFAEDTYFVLAGESIALLAFAAFWLVQTIQRWNEEPGSVTTTKRVPWKESAHSAAAKAN